MNTLLSRCLAIDTTGIDHSAKGNIPPTRSLRGHTAVNHTTPGIYQLKENLNFSKAYITYVFTYVIRVCNHTHFFCRRIDVVQGVLMGGKGDLKEPTIYTSKYEV